MIIGGKPKPTISFAFSLYHNKARLFLAGLLLLFYRELSAQFIETFNQALIIPDTADSHDKANCRTESE